MSERAGWVAGHWRFGVVVLASMALAVPGGGAVAAASGDDRSAFRQINLVSDIPGLATLTDPAVKNPWGIAAGPSTPIWVSNNFSPAFDPQHPRRQDLLTKITLYAGANGRQPITKVPLEVVASAPTGMVFNPTDRFVVRRNGASAPAVFLWDEETFAGDLDHPVGEVTGWSPAVPPLDHGVVRVRRPGAFDLGMTLARTEDGPRLYVANAAGGIDVYDGRFRPVVRPGAFVDPNGAGLSPYNVAALDGKIYVTYTSADGSSDAVSVFSVQGRFIRRLITGAPLAGPWGLVIAPEDWGQFGGKLLVGNVFDGTIHAFDRRTGQLAGVLRDRHGQPLANLGLWGLEFGNGVIGTPRTLLFSAGIGDASGQGIYEHGLIGAIRPVGDGS